MITHTEIIYTALILLLLAIKTGNACRISEFSCRKGNLCLPLDRYCDGKDDCGDASDEPKFCTVCNRTYYGDVGRTYSIKVPTPQWNRLPFLCHLTFTASGNDQGDIVQIIFDGFTVGRFDEGMVENDFDGIEPNLSPTGELPGCPEGFMQLSELGRPFTGGSWCGKATGPQLYFSETSTVTASVKVYHPPNLQEETPFEFRIRYKFISHADAIVRYGLSHNLLELGRVTPGTYCTRQFDECYRRSCRLQSPNYPGMYPRNVTCYWTIRQKNVPTCKHAMISVSQENQHKALVKRSIASLNKTSRSIRAWSDCTGERDHLIFYDGSSTNDPVLAKYCGGDWLPRVISRGPDMLVAFHSSPFSAPLQSGIPNRGFELDVDILFADSDSNDFAKGSKNSCEFHVNASNPDDVIYSRRGRMGKIISPRHTLPPNTTCTYYFHGYPGDLIWISFTNFNLQILQQAIHDNNTLGRADLPPWITRLRMWDSYGTYVSQKSTTTTSTPSSNTKIANVNSNSNNNNNENSTGFGNYYYSAQNPKYGKNVRVNIDNAWNPVDTYIYGPTQASIFNQENKYGGYLQQKFGNGLSSVKESLNYIANTRFDKSSKDATTSHPNDLPGSGQHGSKSGPIGKNKRRLMLEIYDYETPKLCDHTAISTGNSHKLRPCSPLESYVSSGRDLKMEFHTHTGTALYPATFTLNYEFVDTEVGGDLWPGRRGEDPVPPLCSRIFRKRKGNVQAPRNVFLYGRGGAKNLTCLYRFEAGVSEKVRLVVHNVSFGEGTTCVTEPDLHTGRPKCSNIDGIENMDGRINELKLYDVPFRDVKIPLGCFCDNTSNMYSVPLTFLSNSRIMELTFTVTKLNISEDFADVYFYASYEFVRVPECRKKMRLKGSGGEDDIKYPFKSHDSSCDGLSWYIETQNPESSLFVQTWGSYLPLDPTSEDAIRCNTKNRLMIYSGRPLKPLRIICPTLPGTKTSSLHIFSEDWLSGQTTTLTQRPVSLVLEPILKEPGGTKFSWLEIQRTKASLLQQLDLQTNFTANETLGEFGLYSRGADCEFKCPEIDACIGSNLWCDGYQNCPSGFDESEDVCGTARKLLELPGGIFAAFGCIAAALAACLIFCIFGFIRKRKKSVIQKTVLNGTLKKDIKKESLFIDPGS